MPARTLTTTRPVGSARAHQPTRVVLYVRVSSKDQEAEGFSIPAQVRTEPGIVWRVRVRPRYLFVFHPLLSSLLGKLLRDDDVTLAPEILG